MRQGEIARSKSPRKGEEKQPGDEEQDRAQRCRRDSEDLLEGCSRDGEDDADPGQAQCSRGEQFVHDPSIQLAHRLVVGHPRPVE